MSEKRLHMHLKIVGERFLVGSKLMAYILGMTDRNLRNLAEKGCPKENRGWWDPVKVIEWMNNTEDSTSLASREKKAWAEYREAKAEKEVLNLDILKKKYTENSVIDEERVKRILELKRGLNLMIQNVIFRKPTNDLLEEVLTDEIEELLRQYSRKGYYSGNS